MILIKKIILPSLIFFLLLLLGMKAQAFCFRKCKKQKADNGEYVIVLHGITHSNKNMKKIAREISREGYKVHNLSYPSTSLTIEELTKNIEKQIESLNLDKNKKVNFVAHSMGGLITRLYINQHKPGNLGRVVMLATPNHGSEMADFLKNSTLFKSIFGPAGQELIRNNKTLEKKMGKVDYELGIIAGTLPLNPVTPFIVEGKDDGIVSIESTKLKEMTDHITVIANHNFIMNDKEAIRQTIFFLKNGKFSKNKN